MAADWIKVESRIAQKGKILRIARALSAHPCTAVGLCVAFWGWADSETDDGVLAGIVPEEIDAVVGFDGFAVALLAVGWLAETDAGLQIPNFARHHGKSAKRRAVDAARQTKRRNERNGMSITAISDLEEI